LERLFSLDAQFLFDIIVLALSMLVLYTALSYFLFNPVRDMLEKRRQRILDEQEAAKKERAEAVAYKEEYDKKLNEADKEVQEILSEARKKAMKNETKMLSEAKEEAGRIIARANAEIELEKKQALDDMKQEMITIASMMAQKVVTASVDANVQEELIESTLKEIGESTWES
jgi:F-type H+-transporting ATPase subunit b